MSETIDSIIKAATDEIRDYFLKGIADGMADNTRSSAYGTKTGDAYNLGFQIGKDAGYYRNSKTTAPPTPPAKADEWPKVWIGPMSCLYFQASNDESIYGVSTNSKSVQKESSLMNPNDYGLIRLIREARP